MAARRQGKAAQAAGPGRRVGLYQRANDWLRWIRGRRLPAKPKGTSLDLKRIRRIAYL